MGRPRARARGRAGRARGRGGAATEVAPATPAGRGQRALAAADAALRGTQPRPRKPLRERIRNVHIPQLRYIGDGGRSACWCWRAAPTARSSSPATTAAPSGTRSGAEQRERDRAGGDGERRAATRRQRRSRAGDRRGAERHHGAGPGGEGRRGGARRRLHARARSATRRASTRPARQVLYRDGPERARRARSRTGSASTRSARSTRSTRRSPAPSTRSCWSAATGVGRNGRRSASRRRVCGGVAGLTRSQCATRRSARRLALCVRGAGGRHGRRVLRHHAAEALGAGDRAAHLPAHFSPNGDGRFDVGAVRVPAAPHRRRDGLDRDARRRRGAHAGARTSRCAAGRRYRFRWDGRTDAGRVAPTASTTCASACAARAARSRRRASCSSTRVPPRPVVRYVSPDSISPDGAGGGEQRHAALRRADRAARGCSSTAPTCARPRLVAARAIPRADPTARWDGRVTRRRGPPPTGRYLLVVRAQDAAGNVGPAAPAAAARPVARPPRPGRALRGARADHASGGRPGSARAFAVFADGRRYRWRVRRLGSRRIARARLRAVGDARGARVRAARSGVALLTRARRAHAGTRRRSPCRAAGAGACSSCCRTPRGRRATGSRPTATATPTCCREDPRVPLRRPFAGSGLPPGFAGDQSALLRFLDRERLRYDLTTDLALATAAACALDRYTGVLFARRAALRPRASAQELLRAYVRRRRPPRLDRPRRLRLERRVDARRDTCCAAGAPRAPGAVRRAAAARARGGAGRGAERPDRLLRRGARVVRARSARSRSRCACRRGARLLASAGTGADRRALVVYRSDGRDRRARRHRRLRPRAPRPRPPPRG